MLSTRAHNQKETLTTDIDFVFLEGTIEAAEAQSPADEIGLGHAPFQAGVLHYGTADGQI